MYNAQCICSTCRLRFVVFLSIYFDVLFLSFHYPYNEEWIIFLLCFRTRMVYGNRQSKILYRWNTRCLCLVDAYANAYTNIHLHAISKQNKKQFLFIHRWKYALTNFVRMCTEQTWTSSTTHELVWCRISFFENGLV